MLSWCQLAVEFCVQMFVRRLETRYGSTQSLDQLYKYIYIYIYKVSDFKSKLKSRINCIIHYKMV